MKYGIEIFVLYMTRKKGNYLKSNEPLCVCVCVCVCVCPCTWQEKEWKEGGKSVKWKKWAKNTFYRNFIEENIQSGQVLKRWSHTEKINVGERQTVVTYHFFPSIGLVKVKGGCFQLKVSDT